MANSIRQIIILRLVFIGSISGRFNPLRFIGGGLAIV
jgi:hypothetical protein